MQLTDYLTALRKRWLAIAVVALLGAGAGFAMARSTVPMYRSTTKVFVSLAQGNTVSELVQGTLYTQNLVESFAQLATTPTVLEPVIEDLDLEMSAKSLGRAVSADAPLNTMFVEISAASDKAGTAAKIADAVAAQLARTVKEITPQNDDGDETVRMTVVSPAQPALAPFTPNTRLTVMTGGAAGLAAGVVLALALTLLDTRVRSLRDIPRSADRILLGAIPRDRSAARRHTVSLLLNPHGPIAESYRRVQTNLQFLGAAGSLRSIVLTSAVPNDGKSTTAINLALAIAEKGKRVLLVDADLRRPSLADMCGLEPAVGLTTVLIGEARLEDVTQPWGAAGLEVLAAGEVPPNPAQLIDSPAMDAVLAEAGERYDLVILDTPPLLAVTDAAVLARHGDGAVLVVGCSQTRRTQVASALDSLETIGAKCLGIVLNYVGSDTTETYAYQSHEPSPARRGLWMPRRDAPAVAGRAAATSPGHDGIARRLGPPAHAVAAASQASVPAAQAAPGGSARARDASPQVAEGRPQPSGGAASQPGGGATSSSGGDRTASDGGSSSARDDDSAVPDPVVLDPARTSTVGPYDHARPVNRVASGVSRP